MPSHCSQQRSKAGTLLSRDLSCDWFYTPPSSPFHFPSSSPHLPFLIPIPFPSSSPHLSFSCFQRCDVCHELGATVGCCTSWCTANFHFQCAREGGCVFLKTKELFCKEHAVLADDKVVELVCGCGQLVFKACMLLSRDLSCDWF